MNPGGLLIGEVAKRSGKSRKVVRLYEARGILPPAHRTPSGYRIYPTDVVGILAFVDQVGAPVLRSPRSGRFSPCAALVPCPASMCASCSNTKLRILRAS
jgi:hypothetical protein